MSIRPSFVFVLPLLLAAAAAVPSAFAGSDGEGPKNSLPPGNAIILGNDYVDDAPETRAEIDLTESDFTVLYDPTAREQSKTITAPNINAALEAATQATQISALQAAAADACAGKLSVVEERTAKVIQITSARKWMPQAMASGDGGSGNGPDHMVGGTSVTTTTTTGTTTTVSGGSTSVPVSGPGDDGFEDTKFSDVEIAATVPPRILRQSPPPVPPEVAEKSRRQSSQQAQLTQQNPEDLRAQIEALNRQLRALESKIGGTSQTSNEAASEKSAGAVQEEIAGPGVLIRDRKHTEDVRDGILISAYALNLVEPGNASYEDFVAFLKKFHDATGISAESIGQIVDEHSAWAVQNNELVQSSGKAKFEFVRPLQQLGPKIAQLDLVENGLHDGVFLGPIWWRLVQDSVALNEIASQYENRQIPRFHPVRVRMSLALIYFMSNMNGQRQLARYYKSLTDVMDDAVKNLEALAEYAHNEDYARAYPQYAAQLRTMNSFVAQRLATLRRMSVLKFDFVVTRYDQYGRPVRERVTRRMPFSLSNPLFSANRVVQRLSNLALAQQGSDVTPPAAPTPRR